MRPKGDQVSSARRLLLVAYLLSSGGKTRSEGEIRENLQPYKETYVASLAGAEENRHVVVDVLAPRSRHESVVRARCESDPRTSSRATLELSATTSCAQEDTNNSNIAAAVGSGRDMSRCGSRTRENESELGKGAGQRVWRDSDSHSKLGKVRRLRRVRTSLG